MTNNKLSSKLRFLWGFVLWTLTLSMWNIPAPIYAEQCCPPQQYYSSQDCCEEPSCCPTDGCGFNWWWLGGAVLVGGIAGAIAGHAAGGGHGHHHHHTDGGNGGNGGNGNGVIPTAPGNLAVALTLGGVALAGALVSTFVVTPDGRTFVMIPEPGIAFPLVALAANGGTALIPDPAIGTYTVVIEITNPGLAAIVLAPGILGGLIGQLAVAYGPEFQVIALPDDAGITIAPGATIQIPITFAFSPTIFNGI